MHSSPTELIFLTSCSQHRAHQPSALIGSRTDAHPPDRHQAKHEEQSHEKARRARKWRNDCYACRAEGTASSHPSRAALGCVGNSEHPGRRAEIKGGLCWGHCYRQASISGSCYRPTHASSQHKAEPAAKPEKNGEISAAAARRCVDQPSFKAISSSQCTEGSHLNTCPLLFLARCLLT